MKPQKSTTKKKRVSKKPVVQDVAHSLADTYWSAVKESVYEDTILSRGLAATIRAANPRSPEDRTWWDTKGIELVANWIRFREYGNWKIFTLPNGEPAIETMLQISVGDTSIKMAIDRVMVDASGDLCIVDLKTGKRTPTSTLQLGFYKYGLKKAYNIEINKGYYWMARNAIMTDPIDLSEYTDERIEYLVSAFDKARKAHAFIPNTNNCNMCGYTKHCIWYKGDIKNNE